MPLWESEGLASPCKDSGNWVMRAFCYPEPLVFHEHVLNMFSEPGILLVLGNTQAVFPGFPLITTCKVSGKPGKQALVLDRTRIGLIWAVLLPEIPKSESHQTGFLERPPIRFQTNSPWDRFAASRGPLGVVSLRMGSSMEMSSKWNLMFSLYGLPHVGNQVAMEGLVRHHFPKL